MAFRAVLDACVLYPMSLRDTLLRLAELEYYEVYWSEKILDEMCRNLVEERITEEQAARLRAAMEAAFDGASVPAEAIEALEPSMKNHPKDRHVLAAAKAIGAEVVVTSNIKDFPDEVCEPLGIEAMHPDDFLLIAYSIDQEAVVAVLQQQAADLQNPPWELDDLLNALSKTVPKFVDTVRAGMP